MNKVNRLEEPYDLAEMHRKIKELQDQCSELRIGRRILMNLLEATHEEKAEMVRKLQNENEQLKVKNKRLTQLVMRNRNLQIR